MKMKIKKVLIDNRGEIALRILQTCQRLNVGAVIAYSSKDAQSLPVRTALSLGEKDSRYGAILVGGDKAEISYEDVDGVIAAAKVSGCDAVHPGYGFLAERADAAAAITKAGLIFVGPIAKVIREIGNKAAAKQLAKASMAPGLPSSPLIYRYEDALKYAKKIGFPIVLKADLSGGGLGNSFVDSSDELRSVFEDFSLRNPAGFFVEKKLQKARHIEVQLAADNYGNVDILGERDCTAQRKSQKVAEESPVTVVPRKTLELMHRNAIEMAQAVNYSGVGTWEFLYDMATNQYYFMEINPRIQVEHTVTEMSYENLDIVEWQLRIASGEKLPELPKQNNQHVMQLRLYGEDTERNFVPSYGKLDVLRLPKTTADVRIDYGYEQSDELPSGFDSTIAKIIVRDTTREKTRKKALEVLQSIRLSGVSTNRDFLLWLLQTSECEQNEWYTTFIDECWENERKQRYLKIQDFIGDGNFIEQKKPAQFDAKNYLQDLKYTRRGQKRCYSSDLAHLRDKRADVCGFRYGIYESKQGEKFVFGYWDFSFIGGTLGSEEGLAVSKFFQLAHDDNLPAVTITTSGGARQQEGVKALEMMDFIVAARQKYRPKLYINIYSGVNFGGLTVSLAESADISIALTGSKIGFAGPALVARMMGEQNSTDLDVGAQSAEDAYLNRSVDLIVEDLKEARIRVINFCHQINGNNREIKATQVFYQNTISTTRYDRPRSERFITQTGSLEDQILPISVPSKILPSETISQKRVILGDSARLTVADLLNPKYGVFDSVAPLSVRQFKQNSEEFVPIIGALASLDNRSIMVLGQQTQRQIQDDNSIRKIYVAPRANDFRWALRMVELASRLNLPIILFDDTTGGDARLGEEAMGVSRAISDFLSIFYCPNEVKTPVISINLGENGSGGGLTFGRLLDASADLENALTFVSTPDAQIKILTGSWPQDDNKTAKMIDQLLDASAKSRKKLLQIDEVIPEAPGGMQCNPSLTTNAINKFLRNNLDKLCEISPNDLMNRRFKRIKRAGMVGLDDAI